MDKMNREETIDALKEIGSLYDENVVVSISGDGLEALVNSKMHSKEIETEEEKQAVMRENQAIKNPLKVIKGRSLLLIGNIITDRALTNSLKEVDKNIVDAAYDIIYENLLKGDVSGLTENQRQSLISLGMEKAKYLAQNHMDGDKAKQFLSAMETVAKYGMNGKVGQNGKVLFNIKQGPIVEGMDDDYEVLKQRKPELYKKINELQEESSTIHKLYIKHKTESAKNRLAEIGGGELIELWKQAREFLHSPDATGKSPMEQSHIEYNNWKRRIEETKLSDEFSKSDYSDWENFSESIMKQNESGNIFDSDFLNEDLQKFFDQFK